MSVLGRLIDTAFHRRELRWWARQVAALEAGTSQAAAKRVHRRANKLRKVAEKAMRAADRSMGRQELRPLPQFDWSARPEFWSHPVRPAGIAPAHNGAQLIEGMTLYHDCPLGEIGLHQMSGRAGAGYSLALDVFGFAGSYLSLALAVPPEGRAGLSKNDLLGLEIEVTSEAPVPIYARLNVRHGPNTEKVVRDIDRRLSRVSVEFDLFYTEMEAADVTDVWIDIIFDRPALNRIDISDLVLFRRKRANV